VFWSQQLQLQDFERRWGPRQARFLYQLQRIVFCPTLLPTVVLVGFGRSSDCETVAWDCLAQTHSLAAIDSPEYNHQSVSNIQGASLPLPVRVTRREQ
jgi:hypothetical protein